ncbi:glycosyltransferase family 2 protein [Myroides sp. LJL116]
MNYIIIMPAYNEQSFIKKTLDSIAAQSLLPKRLIIVDDNSNDNTLELAKEFCLEHPWASALHKSSTSSKHLPGSKVIHTFNFGLQTVDIQEVDVIVKLDADLILPYDYFEKVMQEFKHNPKAGLVGGFAYIEQNNQWILENLTDKDHIRGAFKAYRRQCFAQIGGLKAAMGWDTVDELLARYFNWEVVTLENLNVKHLKPTGANYDKTARYKQGNSFYRLRYGLIITTIAGLKLASKKKKPLLFIDYIKGYFQAKNQNQAFLVDKNQGEFIRKYRWTKIKQKIKKMFF